jgi:hypothetical protein
MTVKRAGRKSLRARKQKVKGSAVFIIKLSNSSSAWAMLTSRESGDSRCAGYPMSVDNDLLPNGKFMSKPIVK